MWSIVLLCGGAQAQRPRTQTELLIDFARDATVGRKELDQSGIDTARVFLRAALRQDPKSLDALSTLLELETYTGGEAAVAPLLDLLAQADPENTIAFARWLEKGPPGRQTRESRQKWLAEVRDSPRPASHRALAGVRLAELAMETLNAEEARRLAGQAIEICPDCPSPRQMMLALISPDAPPAVRMSAILAVLRTDPVAVETAWQGAFMLDQLGFWADAQMFYDHAFRQHSRRNPGSPVPFACFLRAAENAFARNQRDAAAALMSSALFHGGVDLESGPTAIWMVSRVGPSEQLVPLRKRLSQMAAAVADNLPSASADDCARAAFLLCVLEPDSKLIEKLALAAIEKSPENSLAQRVIGWSHAIAGRKDEAIAALSRIATTDPFAAAKLASLQKNVGDEEAARRTLASLKDPPLFGFAREMLARVGLEAPASQPTELYPDIVRLLKEFDRGIFEFDVDPARFFDAEMEIETLNPPPGAPWRATFSLRSKAAFPIPLGREGLLNPVFLLSFRIEADRSRDYPALFAVTLDRWPALMPGVTLKVSRTLDVGPLRAIAGRFPQQPLRVSVQAIFDPVLSHDGRWIPGPCGRELRMQSLSRIPAVATTEGISAFLESAGKGFPASRYLALESLGDLLGEQQRFEGGKLSYEPKALFDHVPVADALRKAVSNENWETRARALAALYNAGLDAATVETVRIACRDPHWLVRMMAVRLMGRQVATFADALRSAAESDGDELVRDLARTQLSAVSRQPAASAPTETR